MISENYNCIQGYECLAGCISNYFNYYNIGINESDIFLCGGGFSLEYSGNLQCLQIGTKAYEADNKFLRKYKIPYSCGICYEKDGEAFLKDCAVGGIPIMIRVATNHLTYHNVYKTAASSPHWINVIGKCEDGFIISDCAVPALKRETSVSCVSEQEILRAWRNMRYENIILDSGKLQAINVAKIKRDSEDMLYQGILEYLSPSKRFFKSSISGIDAIPAMIKDLQSCQWYEREELGSLLREINYQVKLKGVISYRYVIKMKMQELGCEQVLIEEYDRVTESWNNLLFKLIRVGITGKTEQLSVMAENVMDIRKTEKDVLTKIEKMIYSKIKEGKGRK